jgi:hypothetical protein
MIIYFPRPELNGPKKIEDQNIKQPNMILKTILNFSGVEVLSREEQINIIGKGDPIQVPRCDRYAPPGANPAEYPDYPCIGPEPICKVTIDGIVC